MSLVFSRTIIASVLNIARPAMRVKTETVIAEDTLSARNADNHAFSRSCQGRALWRSTSCICRASCGARSLSIRLTWMNVTPIGFFSSERASLMCT